MMRVCISRCSAGENIRDKVPAYEYWPDGADVKRFFLLLILICACAPARAEVPLPQPRPGAVKPAQPSARVPAARPADDPATKAWSAFASSAMRRGFSERAADNLPALEPLGGVMWPRVRVLGAFKTPAPEMPLAEIAKPLAAVPMPEPRPLLKAAEVTPPASAAVPMPVPIPAPGQPTMTPATPATTPLPTTTPSLADGEGLTDCNALIKSGWVDAELMPPQRKGSCSIASPILLKAIRINATTRIAIEPHAVLQCTTASSVARWVRASVAPNAVRLLGEPVTTLRNAADFDCRSRNRIPGARLSEHGYGNALDVGAFKKASGEWIEVRAPGAGQGFISAVRKDLCGPFTTVLGPGSDPYHSDHLHMDVAKRRIWGRSKGQVCR